MSNQSIVNKDFSTFPTLGAPNLFTDNNTFPSITMGTFYVQTVGLYASIVSSPYTGSGVLTSMDIVGGTIRANSATPISLQLPTFTDFDAFLVTFFGIAIPVNRLVYFNIENIGAGAVTLTSNTNFSIVTQNGTPIVPGFSCGSFKTVKFTISDYDLYGS